MEELEVVPPEEIVAKSTIEELGIFTKEEIQQIRLVKILTGEELITAVVGFDKEIVLLKRPYKVYHVRHSQNGDETLLLQKWNVYSPDIDYVIPYSILVNASSIEDGLVNFYLTNVEKQFRKDNELPASDGEFTFPSWMDEAIVAKDKTRIN